MRRDLGVYTLPGGVAHALSPQRVPAADVLFRRDSHRCSDNHLVRAAAYALAARPFRVLCFCRPAVRHCRLTTLGILLLFRSIYRLPLALAVAHAVDKTIPLALAVALPVDKTTFGPCCGPSYRCKACSASCDWYRLAVRHRSCLALLTDYTFGPCCGPACRQDYLWPLLWPMLLLQSLLGVLRLVPSRCSAS